MEFGLCTSDRSCPRESTIVTLPGFDPFDAARDQMGDPLHRFTAEGLAGLQLQDHRSRCGLFVLLEQSTFGNDKVHAGTFDLFEGQDRPGQFTLQGATVVDLLDKVRDAEVRAVEDLVADDAGLRQSFAGQRQTEFIHVLLRHHDRSCRRPPAHTGCPCPSAW